MQQTEKYKFNLIETSDTFGPEKLNENAQKLEDALTAHEGTVTTALAQHKSETTTALTQHKSEVTTALGAKADKTTLDALTKTVTANKTAADTTIAAVEKGAKLFHLAGPVTGTGMTVNLSGIDMSQYRALLLFVRVGGDTSVSAGGLTVKLSNDTQKEISGGFVWLLNTDATFTMITQRVHYTSYFFPSGQGVFGANNWNSLKSISCTGNFHFIDVYGIKV